MGRLWFAAVVGMGADGTARDMGAAARPTTVSGPAALSRPASTVRRVASSPCGNAMGRAAPVDRRAAGLRLTGRLGRRLHAAGGRRRSATRYCRHGAWYCWRAVFRVRYRVGASRYHAGCEVAKYVGAIRSRGGSGSRDRRDGARSGRPARLRALGGDGGKYLTLLVALQVRCQAAAINRISTSLTAKCYDRRGAVRQRHIALGLGFEAAGQGNTEVAKRQPTGRRSDGSSRRWTPASALLVGRGVAQEVESGEGRHRALMGCRTPSAYIRPALRTRRPGCATGDDHSAKECSVCHHINRDLARGAVEWECPSSGARCDRNEDAAANLAALLTFTPSGVVTGVRKTSAAMTPVATPPLLANLGPTKASRRRTRHRHHSRSPATRPTPGHHPPQPPARHCRPCERACTRSRRASRPA